jgi:hypothetical protein
VSTGRPATGPARRYREPVTVEGGTTRGGAPTGFRWRGRHHVVRVVLAHWLRVGPWWSGAGASVLLGEGDDGATGSGEARVSAVVDDEREHWRVEAQAGAASPVVVELCLARTTGEWTLTGVLD